LLPLQLYPRKNKRKTYLAASTDLSQEEEEINIPRYVYLLFFLR
jgi:hypothetical protein